MASKKIKKPSKILLIGVVLTFLILVSLAGYLYIKFQSRTTSQKFNSKEEEQELVWIEYRNETYGFSFDRPKFLEENIFEDSGSYLSFVRFDPTAFSQAKGVGVGIRKDSLDDEVRAIKKEVDEGFSVKLVDESEIELDGEKAKRLDYVPIDEELEARSFIIVEKDGISISISTHPEQVDKIISSYKFI